MSNRDLILKAALELISSYGYDGVSIRDLVKVVGIRESSYYNHFGSKKELLEDIGRIFMEEMKLRLPARQEINLLVRHRTLKEILVNRLPEHIFQPENPEIQQALYIIMMEHYRYVEMADIIKQFWEVVISMLTEVFSQLVELQKINDCDPGQLAGIYGNLLFSLQQGKTTNKRHEKEDLFQDRNNLLVTFCDLIERSRKFRLWSR